MNSGWNGGIRQGIARTDVRTMARMVGLDRTLILQVFEQWLEWWD